MTYTLNNLKEDVDDLVNDGHGHKQVLLMGDEQNHYELISYGFFAPTEIDEMMSTPRLNKQTDIILH